MTDPELPWDPDDLSDLERMGRSMGMEGDQLERFKDHGRYFILIDDEPVAVPLLEWGRWREGHFEQCVIGSDEVQSPGGRIFRVSTVFLGLDHSYASEGPMILFETMIFDDERVNRRLDKWGQEGSTDIPIRWDGWQMRYSTTAEARFGHALAIKAVETGVDPYDDD